MRAALLAVLLLLPMTSLVPAASAAALSPEEARIEQDLSRKKRDLEEIRRRLKEQKRQQVLIQAREKNVLLRLERMDRELELLESERRVNGLDLSETRSRIGDLARQASDATGRLERLRSDLQKRLLALHRAGARGDNLLSFWLGSKGQGEVSRELKFEMLLASSNEKLMRRTLEERDRLSRTARSLTREEARRSRIVSALEAQKRRTERQRQDRRVLLASLRKQQALRDAAIRDLREAGGDLQRTVDGLLKRAEETRRAARSAAAVPAGRGLAVLKGRLPWPVTGPVISPFGRHKSREFNTTFENTGIQIRAAAGTPVRAIAGGRVRYADWFKGFGKLVILDHGEGYYSLYAQASELGVSEGDTVAAGQTVAAVGDTGSLVGDALYFELRRNGMPVNPVQWLRR
jgi:septal ring factor EnvC (AmiA/AmiB activator)